MKQQAKSVVRSIIRMAHARKHHNEYAKIFKINNLTSVNGGG